MRSIIVAWFLLIGAIVPQRTVAQPDSTKAAALPLALFLDCSGCDSNYIRTMIPWVDYVRDRTEAQVHVLVTTLLTGAAGTEYTVTFLGRGAFLGVNDTLRWVATPMATNDEVRRGLVHVMQLGLVRYVAGSATGTALSIAYKPSDSVDIGQRNSRRTHDPWHGWIISSGVTGYFWGQQSQTSGQLSSTLSADRTTNALKADIGLSGTYSWSRYDFPDDGSFNTYQRNYGVNEQLLWSEGAHWSVGERVDVRSISFNNERLWVRVAPAVEYDLFPYADATRRQLSVQLSVGLVHMRFIDTTLDNRLSLTLGDLRTGVFYGATQPWGSANITLSNNAFLTRVGRSNVDLSPSINIRLARGVSLNLSGDLGLTRDQPYLPRTGLTVEEILVQQQQLATSYTYDLSLGFNFSFGSAFNNVVNPRFSSGSVLTAGSGSP